MRLAEYFQRCKKAALAFSGGVDSAYLLWAAREAGCDLHAYFVKSPFQPRFELEDALRLTRQLGVPFTVEELDVLEVAGAAENGPQRCYYCKKAIFTRLKELAAQDGYSVLWDGTNASDSWEDRPGMRALQELSVVSPLRECGLTKEEIRVRSRAAGLFTADKPAYACLATRIPTGTAITRELLAQIEQGEDALAQMGFVDFRLRYFHGAARLQLLSSQQTRALEHKEEICQALSAFEGVFLELLPRKASE